jgi:tripartite-type tricarboxylate transporter receptor subunit TctC
VEGYNVQIFRRTRSIAVLSAALAGLAIPASAQTHEQFYAGKTIDFVIGYPPGGSNDTLGRLVARHLGKHIPGNPTLVPKNQPGAGSFLAVNTVFNVSPKDGTVIAIGPPTIALDEKLGTQGVRFKTAELNWIGRLDSLVNIVFMWKTSPVKTFADAQKIQATLSGTGSGQRSRSIPPS